MAFDPTKYGATPVASTATFDPAKYGAKPAVTAKNTPQLNGFQSIAQGALSIGQSIAKPFVSIAATPVQLLAKSLGQPDPYANSAFANIPVSSLDKPLNKVGEAAEVGGYLVPGGGVAAPLIKKVGLGLASGYLFDVGTKLQDDKPVEEALVPGLSTGIGGGLPILGKIVGLSNVGKSTQGAANRLEQINLRLTPVEKQNLQRQGKDIVEFLAKQKIIGSPAQRYGKITGIYDDMERQITRVVDGSKVTYPKAAIIDELRKIPAKYADNLTEYDSVVNKTERMIKTLQETRGDSISSSLLNRFKRNEWKNAYSKNNTDVINEVSNDVGHVFKDILDRSIPGLSKINKQYGLVLTARRALFKASSRNQAGLLGKLSALAAGTAIGGTVGNAGGAAVGAFIAPQVANAVSTPIRSTLGAGFQTLANTINRVPVDSRGNIQITRKALLDLIANLSSQDSTEK